MKCPKCSYESDQQFEYCPYCGTASSDLSVSLNPAADKILKALTDPLFLLICIFMTAATAITIVCLKGMPVLNILLSIFLWCTYSSVKKGFADEKQLKNISGTVYAQYIIENVSAVLLFVFGGLASFIMTVASKEEGFIDSMINELSAGMPEDVANLIKIVLNLSGGVLFVIFALIAILTIVINVVFLKRIHLFAKSLYKSVENGVLELHNPKFAMISLFIFGGCSLFSALGSFADIIAFTSTVLIGLAQIFAGVLINKYCLQNKPEGEIYYEGN